MSNSHPSSSSHAEPEGATVGKRRVSLWGQIRHFPTWCRNNPVRAAIAGSLLLAMIGMIWAGSRTVLEAAKTPPPPPIIPLEEAYKALDEKDYPRARKFALQAVKERKGHLELMSEPLFVLGVSIARSADLHWHPAERRPLYTIAARYLEQARNRGFPEKREKVGHYELGRCLHYADRFAESIPELVLANEGTPLERDSLGLLAESYMRIRPPDVVRAQKYNRAYLEQKSLTAAERQLGLLRESRIALEQGDYPAARLSLEQVPKDSELVALRGLLEGKLLMAEGDKLAASDPADLTESKAKYAAAVDAFRQVPLRETTPQTAATAQYQLALCYARQQERQAYEFQLSRVRRQYRDFPEYIAATLDLANAALRNKKYAESVALLQELLGGFETPEAFENPLIALDDLKRQVADIRESLMQAGQFDAALELARGPDGLIPEWQFVQWRAETFKARARQSQDQAVKLPELERLAKEAIARADHRESGTAYARLAKLRSATRSYSDDLWQAVEEFFVGHDYANTVRLGREYWEQEPKKLRPELLLISGESHLCLGQLTSAATMFTECLDDFPRHPLTYRARYLLAITCLENNDLTKAKTLLTENVTNDELSPRSREWRESLFLLGKVHYRDGMEWLSKSRARAEPTDAAATEISGPSELEQSNLAFRKAIDVFTRAVERFPTEPQTLEAMYYLAEANRQAAQWPLTRMKTVTIDSARLELAKQTDDFRRQAVKHYDSAITYLQQQTREVDQTPYERKLLRNCLLNKADTLFQLGRLEEAVKSYAASTYRLQNDPEVLGAYAQIAACYRRLDRPREARGMLEQARVVLARIPSNSDFLATTPFTREQWDDFLSWLAKN